MQVRVGIVSKPFVLISNQGGSGWFVFIYFLIVFGLFILLSYLARYASGRRARPQEADEAALFLVRARARSRLFPCGPGIRQGGLRRGVVEAVETECEMLLGAVANALARTRLAHVHREARDGDWGGSGGGCGGRWRPALCEGGGEGECLEGGVGDVGVCGEGVGGGDCGLAD